MADKALPSPEALRQLLRYEPETGKLFWRSRDNGNRSWNIQWAGKEAFTANNSEGYRHGTIFVRKLRAHRVIWAMAYGAWPADQIDHINGVRDDNRIDNLRCASNQENQRNAAISKNNTSGVPGVCRFKSKWRAQIVVGNRQIHLGYFFYFYEAVAARKAADVKYGFHANHGRKAC